jgi:3-phenylpropionate/cinnamic acid dioxygenase small subunit
MPTTSVDLATQHAVSDVLIRYAAAIDQRDWPLLESCFVADVVADYGDIGAWTSAKDITAFMEATHAPCGHTLHSISNITVQMTAGGATARSYVNAIIMLGDNRTGVRAAGWYDDELVEGEAGWQITRRRFTTVLMQLVTNDAVPAPEA